MRWLVVLALAACEHGSGNPYVADAESMTGSGRCTEQQRCNGIVLVDCGAAVDGPAYYYDEDTVEVIGRCGGFCFTPDPVEQERCRRECPPPGWTCSR
jgi:hypothetical protein